MDLSHLNAPQREAVAHVDGPLLVLAGAGTGKTAVVSHRIAHLIESGIAPRAILAVTFTNRAAREMSERIARLVPDVDPGELTISTFHAFCCQVLRRYIQKLGYHNRFGIADDGDQVGLLKEVVADTVGLRDDEGLEFYRSSISRAKGMFHDPEAVRGWGRISRWERVSNVYSAYQEALYTRNLVDFDDLLYLTGRLWQEHPEVLASYQRRYSHILVDEYQDTNGVQNALVRMLAGEPQNVCVVGDDDQSIYGWRGADVHNIIDFPRQYPGCKVVKLEQNYRSTNLILEIANHVIVQNAKRHDKALWSEVQEGETVKLVEVETEQAEAEMVADLIHLHRGQHGLALEDMAVLFRSKAQAGTFEGVLRERNLPYRLIGANSFYEHREIRDAVAYLRILHNEADDLALLRILNVPKRGLGAAVVEALKTGARENTAAMLDVLRQPGFQSGIGPTAGASVRAFLHVYDQAREALNTPGDLHRKLERYLRGIGYLDGLKQIYRKHEESVRRAERVAELLEAARSFELDAERPVTLQDFLERFSLLDTQDRRRDGSKEDAGVTLMTVHAAKGLEFPLVLLVGMDQGMFPHERALKEGNEDEERRLFYVALTRAKQYLVLLRAQMRSKHGSKTRETMRRSQFLDEMPLQEVEQFTGKDVLETQPPPSRSEQPAGLAASRERLAAEAAGRSA